MQEAAEDLDALNAADPSLIMSMERTLFSALNVGMLAVVSGLALMAAVPTQIDKVPRCRSSLPHALIQGWSHRLQESAS